MRQKFADVQLWNTHFKLKRTLEPEGLPAAMWLNQNRVWVVTSFPKTMMGETMYALNPLEVSGGMEGVSGLYEFVLTEEGLDQVFDIVKE